MLEFDLDKYLRASKKVDLTDLDWDSIKEYPVSVEEARCLAYMMDIESHTVIFLRDLLATKAAFEPEITAFLSCWVYEELWHGEAFSRFLGEAGYSLEPDQERTKWSDPYPSKVARNTWIRRRMGTKGYFAHIATLIGAAATRDFPALHMLWGAVNEYSTLSGYHRLNSRTSHPVLIEMLKRIIKDERRHYAFYRNQAEVRLERSERARKITRWAMKHLWAPVGTGVRPQSETDFVVVYLFSDENGMKTAREMDESIAELPGFAGVRIYQDAIAEAVERFGPIPQASRVAALAP